MKIILVLNHFMPHHIAGTEVYVYSLAKGLSNKGFEVKVLIPHYGKENAQQYQFEGIPVFQYPESSIVDRSLKMGIRQPEGLKYFKKYLLEEQPDVVHFHELAGSNGISINHVLAAKKMGFKVIFTFHLSGYTCLTGHLQYKGKESCDGKIRINKCAKCLVYSKSPAIVSHLTDGLSNIFYLLRINTLKTRNKVGTALGSHFLVENKRNNLLLLANNCDRLVVVSKWYQEVLKINGIDESSIELIHQALPSFQPSSLSHNNNNASGPIQLVFVGRISHFKGIHLLVKALSFFSSNEFELSIYGTADDSNYENDLKIQTANMPNIKWCGAILHTQVIEILKKYDVFCLCSTIAEMSPLVIQESFAAGIPVLASNVHGNKEWIQHDMNGLLFEFNDLSSLGTQLKRLLNDKGLISKLKSNIQMPELFNVVINQHEKLYFNLSASNL